MGELFRRVLIGRIRTRIDDFLGEEQCAFMCGRGCVDQLFGVRQLCEKFLAKERICSGPLWI